MQVKAIERLFVRDRLEGEYVEPGDLVELDDWRADRLIAAGAATTVTASEATKITKAAAKRAEEEAKAAQALVDAALASAEDAPLPPGSIGSFLPSEQSEGV